MKDYIDKLREDYHIKQVKKLRFGDRLRIKYQDMRYGKMSAPEQEVDEYGEPVVKETTPTLNNVTSNSLSQNSYGLQTGLYKSPGNVVTSEVDFGLGPNISSTVGKNSVIDFTPQQKFQNAMTLNQGPTANEEMAAKTVEAETKKLGPVYKVGQEKLLSGVVEPIKKTEGPIKKTEIPEQPSGFFIPPNGDLTTNLYNLGRSLGAKKGTPGRGLAIAGNAGAAALEGSRALFSGVGFSKAQSYTDQFNTDQMIEARKKYESNPQYKNTNYTGNATESRNGGKINLFEEGGEQMDPRQAQMMQMMQQQQGQQEADPRQQQMDPRQAQMMQQQGQQQMDPRQAQMMQQQGQQQMDPRQAQMQQQQQETQITEQESAAYQQIANKLVNSFETIEEIANYLKENKVDQVAYQAILNFAQDMIEDRDESKQENDDSTEEPQNEEEASEEMRKGGKKKFNKKVGEYIEFEYNGKVHKGTIKSIKNGQIFLK